MATLSCPEPLNGIYRFFNLKSSPTLERTTNDGVISNFFMIPNYGQVNFITGSDQHTIIYYSPFQGIIEFIPTQDPSVVLIKIYEGMVPIITYSLTTSIAKNCLEVLIDNIVEQPLPCGPKLEAVYVTSDALSIKVEDEGYSYSILGKELLITSLNNCEEAVSTFYLEIPSYVVDITNYILSGFVFGIFEVVDEEKLKRRILLTNFRNFYSLI